MGWLNWLITGIGAAAAPFTGGLSLAGAGAVNGAMAARGNQSTKTGSASSTSGTGTPGSSSGNWLTGRQIQPNVAPFILPGMAEQWGDWLSGQIGQGAPAYNGALFPNLNESMLPGVWNSWNPSGGQGMDFMSQLLGGGGFQLPSMAQGGLNSLMQTGNMGGRPSQLMENMIQFGGTGGKGHTAIDAMMQYGAPSNPVGQYLANLAQFGVAGPASMPLHDRAMGTPSPFLSAYGTGGRGA